MTMKLTRTGPFAPPFARLLAPLVHSLALHCLLRSFTRSLTHLLPSSWERVVHNVHKSDCSEPKRNGACRFLSYYPSVEVIKKVALPLEFTPILVFFPFIFRFHFFFHFGLYLLPSLVIPFFVYFSPSLKQSNWIVLSAFSNLKRRLSLPLHHRRKVTTEVDHVLLIFMIYGGQR